MNDEFKNFTQTFLTFFFIIMVVMLLTGCHNYKPPAKNPREYDRIYPHG